MRNYVMSFGMNEMLVYFKAKTDADALRDARDRKAEYCIRTTGYRGPAKYIVMPYVRD